MAISFNENVVLHVIKKLANDTWIDKRNIKIGTTLITGKQLSGTIGSLRKKELVHCKNGFIKLTDEGYNHAS